MNFMNLTDRKRLILKAVVNDFTKTAEPVGSSAIVSRYLSDVSSATVRNELASLEKLGLLYQPHTSAGRVPTILGYRTFVDEIMEKKRPDISDMIELQNAMQTGDTSLAGMIRDVAEVISKLTGCVTAVTTPQMSRRKIRTIRLVRLDGFNLVLIVFAEGDMVKHNHIKLDYAVDGHIVDRLSTVVNRELSNLKMEEIDGRSFMRIMYAFSEYPDFVGRVLKLIIRAVQESAVIETSIFGASKLFDYPEYSEASKAKELFEFLNSSDRLSRYLAPLVNKNDITVIIGDESGCRELEGCSVTALRYLPDVSGMLAVIGPVRVDYAKTVSLMEYVNRRLKRILGGDSANQLAVRGNGIFLSPL